VIHSNHQTRAAQSRGPLCTIWDIESDKIYSELGFPCQDGDQKWDPVREVRFFFGFWALFTVGERTPRGWSVENAKAFSAFERLRPTNRGVKFGLFGRTSFALCAKVLRLTQIGPKNQKKIGPTWNLDFLTSPINRLTQFGNPEVQL
jgi:hypothetical protein